MRGEQRNAGTKEEMDGKTRSFGKGETSCIEVTIDVTAADER